MRRLAAFVLSLALATACSRATAAKTGARSSSDVLTQKEIAAVTVDNAYDAVMRLRPMFLRARSTASNRSAYATVFVDGIRRGTPETLRSIGSHLVQEIRYISALDATTRYGLDIEGGVLAVTLIRR